MRFSACRPGKPTKNSQPFLEYVMKLVRPTNTANLVEISLQGASPQSGEM